MNTEAWLGWMVFVGVILGLWLAGVHWSDITFFPRS